MERFKEFLKYLGLLIIIFGVGLLVIFVSLDKTTNTQLAISGGVIVFGFIFFIFTNKRLE